MQKNTMPAYENLVFEGGGIKALAYGGAATELEKFDIPKHIKRVAGTSAGAITACLSAVGYNAAEANEILLKTDFSKFLSDNNSFPPFSEAIEFAETGGIHSGDDFHNWIKARIKEKLRNENITFKELHDGDNTKDLYVTSSNLNKQSTEIFCYETTPDMRIADAVRMSMSVPYYFASVKYKGCYYMDGGVGDNYPLTIFDRKKYVDGTTGKAGNDYAYNPKTLGFALINPNLVDPFRNQQDLPIQYDIKTNIELYKALAAFAITEPQLLQERSDIDHNRTVYINNLGIGTMDFGIDDKKKEALVQSGLDATKTFLSQFNAADKSFVKRVDRRKPTASNIEKEWVYIADNNNAGRVFTIT